MKSKKYVNGDRVGTIAYYGPDDKIATKVVASVMVLGQDEPVAMEKWYSDKDVRQQGAIKAHMMAFFAMHQVENIGRVDHILRCPHEEGIDYPEGKSCPQCPFWENRD